MIKSLWKFIKTHPKPYAIASLLAILSSILYLIPNYIIQNFVDGIVENRLSQAKLFKYLFIYGLISILTYFSDMFMVRILFQQAYIYQKDLRTYSFRRLLGFRRPFYHKFRSGDLMTRLTSDIDSLGDTLGYGVLLIVADALWMLMIFIYLITMISLPLTIVSLIPLIFFGISVFYIGKVVDQRFTASRDAVADLSNQVLEVVEGVRVMRAYGKKHLEQAKFKDKTQKVKDMNNQLYYANALYTPVVRFFTGFSVIISIGYGASQVDAGLISIGQMVAFQIYLGMFLYTIWGISDIFALYQTGKVSYRKIMEILDHDNPLETKGGQAIDSFQDLSMEDYSFTYPDSDKPSLSHISLDLSKGQTLGIVGKTGAGKTTLISQLLRQYPIDQAGAILINNQPIDSYRIQNIESLIGYVPQDHILFSKSVKENILFGNAQAGKSDLTLALKSAHFDQDVHHLSEGLDTLIGEKGVAISGGQKQRVSIARALIREPELLILDDSLSAVDAKTEQAIIQQIQQLRRDKTNIIVSHRLSAVMEADHIIVLEEGRIIEEGRAEELLKRNGWFKEQFDRQEMGDRS